MHTSYISTRQLCIQAIYKHGSYVYKLYIDTAVMYTSYISTLAVMYEGTYNNDNYIYKLYVSTAAIYTSYMQTQQPYIQAIYIYKHGSYV